MKAWFHLLTPLRWFALICVACTSAFLGWLALKMIGTLSSNGWCNASLRVDGGGEAALQACVGLLTIQLKALAFDSHIILGTFALCLGVLVVIVIAGAKLDGAVGAARLNVGRDRDPGDAAAEVADAAADKAGQIIEESKP